MRDNSKTITVNSDTVASHPGYLKVSTLRWLYCRPIWPLVWATTLALSVYLTLKVHWLYALLTILTLALNWFYWRRVKEHFAVGCANPASIISLNPTRIAVYTDLSCGFASPECHTIKIQTARHLKNGGDPLSIGDKVVTVSLYSGRLGKDRWLSFDPIPAVHATKDFQTVEKLKQGMEESWSKLDHWLSKVPTPDQTGLYAFDQGNDIPRGETQEAPDKIDTEPSSPWR